MPLFKSKSKEAFKDNVKTEMKSGKPQKQALAIAYGVQKHAKPKKKMALGGAIETTPKTRIDTKEDESQRKDMKDSWGSGDNITNKPVSSTEAESDRDERRDAFDSGDNLSSTEENTHENEHLRDEASDNAKSPRDRMYALGGAVEENPKTHIPTTEDKDEREHPEHPDFTSEGYAQGGYVRGHYDKRHGAMNPKLAESAKMPGESEIDEHYASIADAILAKKRHHKKFAEGGGIGPEDGYEEHNKFAYGGSVMDGTLMGDNDSPEGATWIDGNAKEEPNRYYRRNEDEILKENYDEPLNETSQPADSNEHGDKDNEDADSHDMVSQIRKKMKYKRSDLG